MALKMRNRYYALMIQNSTVANFDPNGDYGTTYTYRILDKSLPICRYDNDMDICGVVNLIRDLSNRPDWVPKEVYFSHSSPGDLSEYNAFLGCPVFFDAPDCCIIFNDDLRTLPIAGADERLFTILNSDLQRLLATIEETDFILKDVQILVAKALSSGVPTVEDIASYMNMSRRTLQRRLKEADRTYQEVIDDVRNKMTCRYLLYTDQSLIEIAFLLGYSELSAFIRAFRRWNGKTPLQYRQNRQK